MSTISVMVADDHGLVREGLRALVEASDTLDYVGEASRLSEVEAAVEEIRPDVLLLDVEFPDGRSFDICTRLKQNRPELKVLFLTGIAGRDIVNQCLMTEADGFLLKGVKYNELTSAIRDVMAGRSIMDPNVLDGEG